MDEIEQLREELEIWKKRAGRLRQGLEFIKDFDRDNPGKGFSCAKMAEQTLNDKDVIKENKL